MSGSHARPWDPPDQSPSLGRSVGPTSLQQKPGKYKVILLDLELTPASRGNAHRFISSQRLRDVRFVARLRGRETRRSAERQTLAAASTAATQRSAAAAHRLKQRPPAPAGESRSAWKSAQEPARRLRKRRAPTHDGLAHQLRTASTHCRCCHR